MAHRRRGEAAWFTATIAVALVTTVPTGGDGTVNGAGASAVEATAAPTYGPEKCPHHPFHIDFMVSRLHREGGVLESLLGVVGVLCPDDPPYPYRATLKYPAGAPELRAEIYPVPLTDPGPPTLAKALISVAFGIAKHPTGVLFKGTSTFTFMYPKTIPDGTKMKLVLWSGDVNGNLIYGDVLTSVSKNGMASFTIEDLTMPPTSGYGMTLGD